MKDRSKVDQSNFVDSVVVPSVGEIPDVIDDGFVFDRIKDNPNVTKKRVASKSSSAEASSNSSIEEVTGPRPENRPLSVEEAASVQRRIRALLQTTSIIDSTSDQVVSNLKAQLKDYDYQVDISNNPLAKKAVKKLFKKNHKYIDKKMYLEAVERFNEIQKQRLDKEVKI